MNQLERKVRAHFWRLNLVCNVLLNHKVRGVMTPSAHDRRRTLVATKAAKNLMLLIRRLRRKTVGSGKACPLATKMIRRTCVHPNLAVK